MLVHPPDLSLPPEPKDPPRKPDSATALQLTLGGITGGPELLMPGIMVVVSGLAVWQTR